MRTILYKSDDEMQQSGNKYLVEKNTAIVIKHNIVLFGFFSLFKDSEFYVLLNYIAIFNLLIHKNLQRTLF